MWIDCHAHLYEYSDEECLAVVEEARSSGVDIIVSTATDHLNGCTVLHQSSLHPSIWGTAGISPFDCVTMPPDWPAGLHELLRDPKMIAVGEIGIDWSNSRYPEPALQLPVFERQLSLARDLDLPAVIHSRGAEESALELCVRHRVDRALFHCFTGNREALDAIIGHGFFVSLSGIVTFPKSHLRDLIFRIPPDRLLIETDSPYLAPVPYRGKKNRPARVGVTGSKIAEILGKPEEELQCQLERNFRKLFSKFELSVQSGRITRPG